MKIVYGVLLLCSILLGDIKVGQIIEGRDYACLNNILYRTLGHGFGVLFNPLTDNPFHCTDKKVVESGFVRDNYRYIITITK